MAQAIRRDPAGDSVRAVPRRLRPAPVPPGDDLEPGFDAVRRELEIPDAFPDEVLGEAASAAARAAPADPALGGRARTDLRDVAFVTLDPPGSRDLDQAFELERRAGGGWRVRYAIADVAAFVVPGGAVDTESWARGMTLYAPDVRVPLHPVALSEGAASLLPDEQRPACVWTIDLDAEGEQVAVDLCRAWVRSRAQLDYPAVQRADDGSRTSRSCCWPRSAAARAGGRAAPRRLRPPRPRAGGRARRRARGRSRCAGRWPSSATTRSSRC